MYGRGFRLGATADISGPRLEVWTRRLTGKVEAWPCRISPVNIFLGGDSLTQIESSLGGLARLVSKGGQWRGQEPGDLDDI